MAQVLENIKQKVYKYKKCLLEKTLKISIKGCDEKKDECVECQDDLCLLNSLINGLEIAIENQDEDSAIKIVSEIEKMCKPCHNCPE